MGDFNKTKLVVLMGVPASGKSSTARYLKDEYGYSIQSSDAIRGEINGDEADQSNPQKVFSLLHKRTVDDLLSGKNVVFDTMGLQMGRLFKLLNEAYGSEDARIEKLEIIAIFLKPPLEECLHWNENRERVVPEEIIINKYEKIRRPENPIYDVVLDRNEWRAFKGF